MALVTCPECGKKGCQITLKDVRIVDIISVLILDIGEWKIDN